VDVVLALRMFFFLVLYRCHSKNLSFLFSVFDHRFACLLFSLVEHRNTGRLSLKVNSERGHWPELIVERKLWALAIIALAGGHHSWTLGFCSILCYFIGCKFFYYRYPFLVADV